MYLDVAKDGRDLAAVSCEYERPRWYSTSCASGVMLSLQNVMVRTRESAYYSCELGFAK